MQGGEEDDGEASISKVSRFKDKNINKKSAEVPEQTLYRCSYLTSYKTKTSYSKGSLVAMICLPLAILICVVILFLLA